MDLQNGIYRSIRIKEIREALSDFKIFVFEDGHHIDYKSGQYLTLVKKWNGEEVRRSYSITSSPNLNESLSIGVKRIQNGFFSRQLIDEAVVGDEWITIGAAGFFCLPDDIQHYQQLFFFAAGSGITPIYSLIKTALHLHEYLQIVLIYSNASINKTVFDLELKELSEKFSTRFHIEFLYSDAPDLSTAHLHRDLLLKFVQELSHASFLQTLYYSCGPESYMRLCTYTLQEVGVPSRNIRKENFVVNALPLQGMLPPDKESRQLTIKTVSGHYKFTVAYPDSILRSAKKQGILLPYSCEAGRCGNCVAKCISGKVWHSYNEVLTEKDLEQGLILTCVGHPVGGDVKLEIG